MADTQSNIDSCESDPSPIKTSFLNTMANGTIVAMAAGLLGIFVFSLLGRYFFYAEVIGNFRLQLAGLMLVMGLIVFRMKPWRNLAYFLLIGTVWSLIQIGNVYIPAIQPPPGEHTLKVMSFNVLGHNISPDSVLDLIKEHDPDVLCVLEYSRHWKRRLKCLDESHPHQVALPRWHGFGAAFFSKYPLSETRIVALTAKKTDNPFIITNVTFEGQTIRLAGTHVLSPTSPYRLQLRNQQFREIASTLVERTTANSQPTETPPTVVMGDFNCTPWSPFLKDFVKQTGYRDSRRGFGHHPSWHCNYWLLRLPIDHAFVSEDVHVHSRKVGGTSGSDHMPIIFEISVDDEDVEDVSK